MNALAQKYLQKGDVANAAALYSSLEKLNASKYNRMARLCRVLHDPTSVPLPHRHNDVCDALLELQLPPDFLLRDGSSFNDVRKRYQQLVIYVHPDKNPLARAHDAFQKLILLKEKALELVNAKEEETVNVCDGLSAQSGNGSPLPPPQFRRKSERAANKKSSGVRRSRLRARQRPNKTTAQSKPPPATMLDLAEVRDMPIRLKSLKRRDIDGSFQIFSRPRLRHDAEIVADDENAIEESDALAGSQSHHEMHKGDTTAQAPRTTRTERTHGRADGNDRTYGSRSVLGRTMTCALEEGTDEDEDVVLAATMPARTCSRESSHTPSRHQSSRNVRRSLQHTCTTPRSTKKRAQLRTSKPPWVPCTPSLYIAPGMDEPTTEENTERVIYSCKLHGRSKHMSRYSLDESTKSSSLHTSGSLDATMSSVNKTASRHVIGQEDTLGSLNTVMTKNDDSESCKETSTGGVRVQLNQMIKDLQQLKLASTNVHLVSDLSFAAYENLLCNRDV